MLRFNVSKTFKRVFEQPAYANEVTCEWLKKFSSKSAGCGRNENKYTYLNFFIFLRVLTVMQIGFGRWPAFFGGTAFVGPVYSVCADEIAEGSFY